MAAEPEAETTFVCYVDQRSIFVGHGDLVSQLVGEESTSVFYASFWALKPSPGFTLIRSPDQQAVWRTLGALRRLYTTNTTKPHNSQRLTLVLPCGYGETFMAYDDIPRTDLPCPCGDPDHYLIRYSGKKPKA